MPEKLKFIKSTNGAYNKKKLFMQDERCGNWVIKIINVQKFWRMISKCAMYNRSVCELMMMLSFRI